jgi:hypothetical protein
MTTDLMEIFQQHYAELRRDRSEYENTVRKLECEVAGLRGRVDQLEELNKRLTEERDHFLERYYRLVTQFELIGGGVSVRSLTDRGYLLRRHGILCEWPSAITVDECLESRVSRCLRSLETSQHEPIDFEAFETNVGNHIDLGFVSHECPHGDSVARMAPLQRLWRSTVPDYFRHHCLTISSQITRAPIVSSKGRN